jgi:uncharacterized protein YbjT (DUF2867 family)
MEGVSIRAGSSQPAGLQGGGRRFRPVNFDWSDPNPWRDAAAGADAIYLMRPDLPQAPELVAKLVSLNPTSHIVLLSEQGAEKLPENHWVRRVETAVTEHSKTWTVLRPSWFQQNLTDPRFSLDSIRHDRVFSLPSGGGAIAWVDVRDIAVVAVAALIDESGEYHRRAHTITGPQPVTVPAIADMLSEQLGEPVRAIEPPASEAVHGTDPWVAELLADLYERVRVGDFADVTQTVESVTGRESRTMADFIREHGDQWQQTSDGRPGT